MAAQRTMKGQMEEQDQLMKEMYAQGRAMGVSQNQIAQALAKNQSLSNLPGYFTNAGQQAFTLPPYVRDFGIVDSDVVRTSGIYAADLSVIVDMWRVTYPGWIFSNGLPTDKNEEHHFMFKRLKENGKFEVVTARDAGGYSTVEMVRLKENA